MRKIVSFFSGVLMMISAVQAQKISGVVKDQQGKGLEKVTVSLLKAKDSSVAKLSVSADNGVFSVNFNTPGRYLISASHVGYTPVYTQVFDLTATGEIKLPDLVMVKSNGELKAVTVVAQKPMVEVRADKTILNVEGTINSVGNNALELLQRSPGVMVDKDENISLAGKNGVQIYIDGKPSPLSGADLAAYLKNLQSAQIEAIEIITNPSAKYEAAGNGGIINIRLKKNKTFGTNGSVNAGYNIGTYGKYNAGISLNHRNKKTNLFANYNFNDGLYDNEFKLYRTQLDTLFNQQSAITSKNLNNGFKAGLDYFANKKSTYGVLVSGNLSDNTVRNYSSTPISYIPTGITDRVLVADNKTVAHRNNINTNFNYHYLDSKEHDLNIDADYDFFRTKSDQFQPNTYYNPPGTFVISQFIYDFVAPTNIDVFSLKSDYEQNYKKGKLGLGFKTSLVNTTNHFGRFNVISNVKQLDLDRSNQFNYSENINAAYVNYNRGLKGVMIQAGLRVENTNATGNSYPLNADGSVNKSIDQVFKRHYTDLFPSAAITFNKHPMNQWGLSYSRRIDRPAYQDLNPFEFKLDEYTFQKGNTLLRPQYTNSISLTNTFKYKLTTSLTYSHVADVFTQLIDTADRSKAFISKQNLATQDIAGLNISYPYQHKNYSAFVNVNSYYSHYRADFGGGNRVINLNVFAYTVYMQHALKLGKKGWSTELNGFFASPTIWQGTFKSHAIWSLNSGLSKTILKGKGSLKGSFTDMFFTQKFHGESNFAGQQTIVSGHQESRQFRINFSYRFGSNQVKAARNRNSGSEDENKRTQSSGGLGNQ